MTDRYEDDIPLELAVAAHRGTSFYADKRGEQERADYAQTLQQDRDDLAKLADTPGKAAILDSEFSRYRHFLRTRTLSLLSAKSRCVSTMIAGPARFPVERQRKRSDAADKRLQELLEYRKRALEAIRRKLCPEEAPIMSGDADAVDRLRAKIAEAEQKRDAIKAAPHEPWELSNLGANIRRMRERLAHLERTKAMPEQSVQGTAARVEDCPAENRVRLHFPGKPSEEIRSKLKSRGFRWAPSLGCWSSYRSEYALATAREVAGIAEAKP